MRLKLKRPKGISLQSILMNIAMFCVVSFALLEDASVSLPYISFIKTPLMYLGAACLLCRVFYFAKRLKKKRYFYVFLTLFLLIAMLLLAANQNDHPKLGDPPMKDTVRLILFLLELFLLMIWMAEDGQSRKLINFLFYYTLLLTGLSDILMFTGLMEFWNGGFETYLVGTKFTVIYFHMNLMVLWYVKNRERFHRDKKARRVIYWGMPVAFLTAIRVDCISGILGCLVLFILIMIMDKPIQKKLLKLSSHWALLLAMAIGVIFPFVSKTILDMPFVTYVVENLLGRDNKLTGRLNIFLAYGDRMQDNWQWGYGYGNGNVVSEALFGYANSQNAMLHWVIQIGIPATVCLVLFWLMIFRRIAKAPEKSRCMPFVALIYVYIVLGMIEITYSMIFILWFAVIFMLVNEKRTPEPAKLPSQPVKNNK